MNNFLQRTFQRQQRTLFKPIHMNLGKHYQAQLIRQPIQQQIIIIFEEPIIQETKAQQNHKKIWAEIKKKPKSDSNKEQGTSSKPRTRMIKTPGVICIVRRKWNDQQKQPDAQRIPEFLIYKNQRYFSQFYGVHVKSLHRLLF